MRTITQSQEYGLAAIGYLIFGGFIYALPILLYQAWLSLDNGNTSRDETYLLSMELAHLSTYLLGNLFYGIIYYQNSPFFEQFKIEEKPWPWNQKGKSWMKMKKIMKMIGINFMQNQVIGLLIAIGQTQLGVPYRFIQFITYTRMDIESFPTYLEIVVQIIACGLLEDFLFYCSHRILHLPGLYHQNELVSFACEYAHPIEYLLGNLAPVLIPPALLGSRMHMVTMIMWQIFSTIFRIIIAITKILHDHCGYKFPWEPYNYSPIGTNSSFHSFHHSNNIGNYGSAFIFWDRIFKTDEQYLRSLSK